MKRFAVAYASERGMLPVIAGHVAEGLRMAGHSAEVACLADLVADGPRGGVGAPDTPRAHTGDEGGSPAYDGYVVGATSFDEEMERALRRLLPPGDVMGPATVRDGDGGRRRRLVGGAFSSYDACGPPASSALHEFMEETLGTDMRDLGPLSIEPWRLGTPEGTRAAQQFGKALGERAGGSA